MKKLSVILAIVLVFSLGIAGCGKKEEKTPEPQAEKSPLEEMEKNLLTGTYKAEINIKDYGTITVEMDADKAPISVTRFVTLADNGFYDGLTFHRIMKDFMMQGGDPFGDGTGGLQEKIKGEFKNNGVDNDQAAIRGAIAFARSQNYDSASCQFFIVHKDSRFLDGDYAVFGYVTDGIDVVDDICNNVKNSGGNGAVAKEDQPVIESIVIVE